MATKKQSEITAHIELDTSGLNKGLENSSKKVKEFTAGIKQSANTGLSGFTQNINAASVAMKALPIVAVAAGVGKLTKSIMDSSQAGDILANAIAAGKTSIDSFFSAISTGDWSAFNDGILGAISNARELAETLDALVDIELANTFVTAEYESALAHARSIMNDSTKSEKEKADALEAVRVAQQRAIAVNNDYIAGTRKAIVQTYKAQTGIEQTVDNILEYIRTGYNLDSLDRDELVRVINDLNTEIKGRKKLTENSGNLAHRTKAYKEETKAMQLQLKKYLELNNASIQWQKFNDDERKSLSNLAITQHKSTVAVDNMTKAYNRLINAQDKANNPKEKKEKTPKEDPYEKYYNSKIKPTFEKLDKIKFPVGILVAEPKLIKVDISKQPTVQMPDMSLPNAKLPISAIIPVKIDFEGLEQANKNRELQFFLKELYEIEDEMNKTEALKKYVSELNHVGNAFGSLSELSGAAGMKEAALAFSIAKIMAGGAAAIAKAFKDETWIGGIAAAVGVAASLASTIASFNSTANRYASGGIVPGSSFSGDSVRALVNSGEMILNRGQQTHLFDMINGGGGQSGGGAFVVRGTDLMTVINNTASKAKKIRYRYD